MLNRQLYYNLFLGLLPPLLFFVMMFWGITAWLVLVPSLLLIFGKTAKQSLLFSLVPAILTPAAAAFFLNKFDIAFFFYFILYFGSFYILFILLTHISFNKIKYPFVMLAPPVIWLALIPLYSLVPGDVYWWFNFGGMQPLLFPFNYYMGSYAVTFFIVFFNTAAAFYIINRKKHLLYIISVFILVILFCFLYNYCLPADSGKKVKVAIIQGNFSQDFVWRSAHASSTIFETYKELTLQAAKEKPDIIVWPEYALPMDITLHKDMYEKISSLAKEANANLVFGTLVGTIKTDPQKNFEWNTAFVFSRQGDQIGRYDANKPFPYRGWVLSSDKSPVITTDVGKIGIAMCYEEFFPKFFKKYKKAGVQFFITLSNDDPIHGRTGMAGKVLQVRTRAAENNLYLLRVANTGLTEVINPHGKTVASLEPNKEGYLVADIYIND